MNRLTTLFQVSPKGLGATVYGLLPTRKKCPTCKQGMVGRKNWEAATVEILNEDAEFYVDWVGGLETLISRVVYDDMKQAGISGFRAHPVPIDIVRSDKLREQVAPDYFALEVLGEVDIDRQLFDEYDGNLCDTCGRWSPKNGGKYGFGEKNTIPILETWDGSDLVKVNNIKSTYLYCSRRVIDLARERNWTGFSARIFGGAGSVVVNHKSPTWLEEFEAVVRAKYPEFCKE